MPHKMRPQIMASGPNISWQIERGKKWKQGLNLIYADDTILMVESKEELKSLLI